MSRLRFSGALAFSFAAVFPLLVGGCPVTEEDAGNGDAQAGPPAESLVEASLTNQRPVAKAGDDVTAVSGELVSLSGVASTDADGDRLSFVWQQVAGEPQAELKSPFSSITNFVAPAVGAETVLVFRLSVVDGFATASDEVTVTVLP